MAVPVVAPPICQTTLKRSHSLRTAPAWNPLHHLARSDPDQAMSI